MIFSMSIFAQEETKTTEFSIDGQFRTRLELQPSDGGRNVLVADETAGFTQLSQRSRITFNYKSGKLQSKFAIQDVRLFGSNKSVKSNNGSGNELAVHQAWLKYKLADKICVKLGRQELNYADARLLWNKNWLQEAASYDAVVFQGRGGLNWDVGFVLNSAEKNTVASQYRALGFFNISKKINDNITVNLTDLFEGYENGTTTALYGKNTIGINPVLKFGALKFNASFYYQNGKVATLGATQDYAGMMYTANISYKLGKITIGAGYDSYSGDDDATDDKNQVFTTPYAGAHKFFGNTDFHLKLFGLKKGINDINIKVNASLTPKTSINLALHMISLGYDDTYKDANNVDQTYKNVGNNIDFVLKHKFGKKMALLFGYSAMLASDEYKAKKLGAGTDAKFHQWAWVMVSFSPNFFKYSK